MQARATLPEPSEEKAAAKDEATPQAEVNKPAPAPSENEETVWQVLSIEQEGVKRPADEIKDLIWCIRDGFVHTGKKGGKMTNGIITFDPTKTPKQVSGIWQLWGNYFYGIYKLEGDILTVCEGNFASPEDGPKTFGAPRGSGLRLIVLQRVPEGKADKRMTDSNNPCYTAWAGKPGEMARFTRTCSIIGGPPPGDTRVVARQTVVYTLLKRTAELATVDVTIDGKRQPKSITIRADLGAEEPGRPRPAGEEKVTIGKKTYPCKVYRYETRSEAEVGRDCEGLPATVTVWITPGVPGGVVRRRIELTIKATYTIEETILPPE
jgi:uncharacterized protein (TIGR03067 family)